MRRPYLGIALHAFDVLNAEVAHANALRLALVIETLQRLPHLLDLLASPAGAMDHEQVHVSVFRVHLLDTLDTLLIALLDGAGRNEDLRGDEDVFTRQTRFLQGFSDLVFILVKLGAVNVTVPGFQGYLAGFSSFLAKRLVDSEAELG